MRSSLVRSAAGLQHLLRTTSVATCLLEGGGGPWGAASASNHKQDSRNVSQSTEVTSRRDVISSGSDCKTSRFSSPSESLRGYPENRRMYAATESTQSESKEGLESSGSIHVNIEVPYELHMLETGPSQDIRTSKEELMQMYRHMTTLRRMEIQADMLFKAQFIRGFCHLYDGKEAVSVGDGSGSYV